MSTKLKICGITNLADARYCAGAGVDYLGFIQYEKSPRYIAPKNAKEIIEWLYGPQPVGVFVNADADHINTLADDIGFELVQLHGHEPTWICAEIEAPIIKAIHVEPNTTPDDLQFMMDSYVDVVDYFLLDTKKAGLWGGTGEAFNWDVAAEIAATYPFFLAGGITAENVADAITRTHPFGIDLSSSVESAPGQKDFDKLADFFDAFTPFREDLSNA